MSLTEQEEQQVHRVVHFLPRSVQQQLNVRHPDNMKDLHHTPHSEWTLLDVVRVARTPQPSPLWSSHMRWCAQRDKCWKTVCCIAYTLAIMIYININNHADDVETGVGPGLHELD